MIKAICALLLCAGLSHAVLLGGTEVPKDKFIVYILIGHSNMSGENHPQADGVAAPRTWYYQWYKSKTWMAAKEPPNHPEQGLSGRNEGGPGIPFLKGMAAAYPDYHFGVISNATVSCTVRGINTGHNGSGIPADSNRYWKGATLYNEIPAIVNPLKAQFTLGGIICMLGTVEATRTSDSVCRRFGADAAQMAKDYRADLGMPDLPFIIGEYEAGASQEFALTMPWPKLVDQQIKLIPSLLPNSATVNSVGISMGDNHHYDIKGEGEFAKRVIQAIQDHKWTPQALGIRPAPRGAAARAPAPYFLSRAGAMALPGSAEWRADGPASAPRLFLADGKLVPEGWGRPE
jgi:hypothetical protein